MFPQRAQSAAGRGERRASRVRAEAGPDGVVLKRVGLTARVKVRVRRRLHGRHTRVISVQIRVIHFVHVEDGWRRQVLRVPITRSKGLGERKKALARLLSQIQRYILL